MNVSKSSWHYKLYELAYGYGFRRRREYYDDMNLCKYFWLIMFAPLLIALKLLTVVFLAVFGFAFDEDNDVELVRPKQAIVMSFLLWLFVISLPFLWYNKLTMTLASVVLLLTGIIAAIALVVLIVTYIKNNHNEGVSLVGEFVRARKMKVCPMIKFVKEGDKEEK